MAPAQKTKETLQVATESFFAAWCSACYDAMQANARTCLAFFLRIRCEVRSKCTSRKGLFYLKTGCANKLTRMEASVPAQGARPRGALLPEPNHAKPKGQQMALANRMLLVTWAARPCLLNRGHKQAAKVAVNINGSWPQVICHAPFAWRPAMMLGSCSCLGCGLVWAVYRREVAQLRGLAYF